MRLRNLAFALILLASPAAAVEDADRAAVRSVIEMQLEAFRKDDAAAAYALASPAIRGMFPSEERFLDMVRNAYKPVHRNARAEFQEIREADGGLAQVVRLRDLSGIEWLALYTLERQPDGSWKISGCSLLKAPDEAA